MITRRRTLMAIPLIASVPMLATACQAPAPTPAPAEKPAEKPAQAAPAAPVTSKLLLSVDVVIGSKNMTDEQKKEQSCLFTSKFPRNSQIVWRARVYDPRTGEQMDDVALTKAQIKLANGTNLDMKYGPHGEDPNKENFWTGSWVIPKDAPTGTLMFTVAATSGDGRTGEWAPFRVPSSYLTVLDKVVPDVVTPPKPKA